jgi:hypothetical protein
MLEKMFLIELPTLVSRVMATTEIKPAISAYSINVTPFLSDLSLRMRRSMSFPLILFKSTYLGGQKIAITNAERKIFKRRIPNRKLPVATAPWYS